MNGRARLARNGYNLSAPCGRYKVPSAGGSPESSGISGYASHRAGSRYYLGKGHLFISFIPLQENSRSMSPAGRNGQAQAWGDNA